MNERTNSKWLEGLVLLIILAATIFLCTFATRARETHVTILDEQVSLWSGSIDNLE